MGSLQGWARKVMRLERGSGIVEYALVISLIAIVAIGALAIVGDEAAKDYDCATDALNGQGAPRTIHTDNGGAIFLGERKVTDNCL